MKAKCPECGTGKVRRSCRRAGDAEICSECCASLRGAECGDCVHYASTLQYEENRRNTAAGLSGGHFLMEINPEVQDIVTGALEAAQRGEFESAMGTLTGLLEVHPRHADVPYGIGLVHALKREHEESIAWFDRAIGIDPNSVESHFNKAVAFQKLFDLPNCIRSYQKVVAIGPGSDPAVARARSIVEDIAAMIRRSEGIGLSDYLRAGDLFNDAFELMNRGNWLGALKGFRASAALNERSAPTHGNTGLCFAYLGRRAEALAELDRALDIDPEYLPAASNRRLVEQMTEGQPMDNTTFKSINFARENLTEELK